MSMSYSLEHEKFKRQFMKDLGIAGPFICAVFPLSDHLALRTASIPSKLILKPEHI